jgi:hypothetical protein
MAEPIPAQTGSDAIGMEAGRRSVRCACGQYFCDGSHSGTGPAPLVFKAGESRCAYFRGCTAIGEVPFRDGTRNRL